MEKQSGGLEHFAGWNDWFSIQDIPTSGYWLSVNLIIPLDTIL